MKIKKISAVLCSIMMLTPNVLAKENKLQLFFSSGIMNDVTGEFVTDISIRNFETAIPKGKGDISRLKFEYTYDNEIFDVKKDENGNVELILNNALVKYGDKIIARENDGKICVSFADDIAPIECDGIVCGFTLVAKDVNALWNSFNSYPLRFVEGSIKVETYNWVTEIYSGCEGIDGKVGAYNRPPSFNDNNINVELVYSLGSTSVEVDGNAIVTDAEPLTTDDGFMIPMRYFAENTGMEVEWDSNIAAACAYACNGTLKLFASDGAVYINSALCEESKCMVTESGRMYMPLAVVEALYPNAIINAEGEKILIYIP